jgi:hypothetical protein
MNVVQDAFVPEPPTVMANAVQPPSLNAQAVVLQDLTMDVVLMVRTSGRNPSTRFTITPEIISRKHY